MKADFKSRLVACGQYEDTTELRTDSPTCELEALNLIMSYAACYGFRLKCGDIRNAYFQGKEMDRVLLLKPPRGGLPGEGDLSDTAILARVPIYGIGDSGRMFWKRLREEFIAAGFQENKVSKALYSFQKDGIVKCMVGTHVDDILWASDPEFEFMVQKILDTFSIRKIEEDSFRFCGREIAQDKIGNITVTCRSSVENVLPINFETKGRKGMDKATAGEIGQLRSVVGSLAWVCRQCRPRLSYAVSRLQSVAAAAQVKDLSFANKLLQEAKEESHLGMTFKAKAFDWNDAILVTISDASFAGEKLVVDDQVFPRRSQRGRITCIADPKIWDGDKANMHIIGWRSTMIKRVCRSTFNAETQALIDSVAAGARVRTIIADCKGLIAEGGRWLEQSRFAMRHMWLTDCESLHSYLVNPVAANAEDKRLEIDLQDLRQILWEDQNGNPKDDLLMDQSDKARWIDTSAMLADPLTKLMKCCRLEDALSNNVLDLEATAASQMQKLMKQKQRASRARKDTQDINEVAEE